ncbi:MAG: TetR/AcrR family transcriptional regulator [Candidatus Acidiferrales bacterium]
MAVKRRSIAKQKKHTGQRILSAAFKCISTKGSASVSLRDIADEAGVVLSQLNYYYDNREQLFAAVLRWMKEDYIANVEARMDSFGTLNEKARFLIQYNQDLLQTNRRLYRAFLDFFGLALWSPSFKKEMNGFLNDILRVIERQIEPRTARDAHSPAALATMILGTTFGIAMQYLMNPEREEILRGFDILLGVL